MRYRDASLNIGSGRQNQIELHPTDRTAQSEETSARLLATKSRRIWKNGRALVHLEVSRGCTANAECDLAAAQFARLLHIQAQFQAESSQSLIRFYVTVPRALLDNCVRSVIIERNA